MYFEWEGAPNSNIHFYRKWIAIRFFILFFAFKKLEGQVCPSFYSSLPSCSNHPAPLCSIKEPPQILTMKYDFPQKLLTRDICKIFVLICQASWPNMAILQSCNKTGNKPFHKTFNKTVKVKQLIISNHIKACSPAIDH